MTVIYVSPHENLRKSLWEDLKNIAMMSKAPWLFVRDFNNIAYMEDKKGGAHASIQKCSVFRERIQDCMLMDLPAAGPLYTWRDPIYRGGQCIYEKLDRVM